MTEAPPLPGTFERVTAAMSTTVSVQLVGVPENAQALAQALADDALQWFSLVEAACSRFDAQSELRRVTSIIGTPQPVSPLLFELLQLAVAVADASDGAFDPCVGDHLLALGFDRHWQTGAATPRIPHTTQGSWRDLSLFAAEQGGSPHLMLRRALHLDLGAIAKGFALDLAARTLAAVPNLCVNAGGDLIFRGHNAAGERWRTGIVDPLQPGRLAATLTVHHVGNVAVCTSGDYARRTDRGHHLVDPRTGVSADHLRSVTVVAPQAAVADALATAVFVMGSDAGASLLREQQADGLLIDADGVATIVHGWGTSDWTLTQGQSW